MPFSMLLLLSECKERLSINLNLACRFCFLWWYLLHYIAPSACIYIYIYIYTHTHKLLTTRYKFVQRYIHFFVMVTYIYIYMCMYLCMHACMYVCQNGLFNWWYYNELKSAHFPIFIVGWRAQRVGKGGNGRFEWTCWCNSIKQILYQLPVTVTLNKRWQNGGVDENVCQNA